MAYTQGNELPEIEKLKQQAWDVYNKTNNWSNPQIAAIHQKAEQLRALQNYSGGVDGSKRIELKGTPTTIVDNKIVDAKTGTIIGDTKPMQSTENNYTPTATNNNDYSNYAPETPQSYEPQYSTQNIIDMITKNANQQYNAQADNLRGRVANIIAQFTQQLGGVDAQYQQAYQQNEQSKYQSNEAMKEVLARAGLLGSGVQIGNLKQNEMNYNMSNQAIDLQKQAQKDKLGNQITNTQRDLEYELNKMVGNRDSYINEQTLGEMRRTDDIGRDEYWKQYEANLKRQEVINDMTKFDKMYSLQERQQLFAEESFIKQFDLDARKFNELQDQFAKTFGLEEQKFSRSAHEFNEQMKAENDRFDRQMGFNEQVHADNMKIERQKLNVSIANANRDYELAQKRLEQEMREYDDSLVNLATRNAVEESRRIDEAIIYAIERLSPVEAEKYINGLINTSQLSSSMKTEKFKMINNALEDIKGKDTKQSGLSERIANKDYSTGGNWGIQGY